MPDVKERIMSNRKYIKSLLLGMSVMMTILIAIQIYLTVYVLKHNEMLPRILSCTALILDIIILAVFFVSSRINAAGSFVDEGLFLMPSPQRTVYEL